MKFFPPSKQSCLIGLCICTSLFTSCRNNDKRIDHTVADQLFAKSVKLIELYTDSIANASDSASFNRMVKDFDEKIAKVNFQFPANTDLQMTHDENDSIIHMLDRLVKTRKDKEKALCSKDSLDKDSTIVVSKK